MRRVLAMASGKKSSLLSSLADYGDDSEPDSDIEDEDTGTEDRWGGLVSASYGEDDISRVEDPEKGPSEDEESGESSRHSEIEESDEGKDADDVKEIPEAEKKNPHELVALFSEKVRNMSPDKIRIPSEPAGRCPSHLQEKICKLYERKLQEASTPTTTSRRRRSSGNPSIYEKLIQFCGIDELGTNYPKDMFDPHGWSEDSYYEALAKAQKVEMDKMEKARKDRTKIEFVTGTKKGTTSSATSTTATAEAQKRKSKWDSAVPVTVAQPPLLPAAGPIPGVVSVTTTASGTKTTVISAVGTILKKAKQ
ncbi:LOW QUALITY PROTEIN: SAP30-binding protein [Gadus macrocephalus]|uniref:LOW QUALITY PROTEIN: SAP30-binding protein n=1 Tax=Gadus macrocephalus TaxID=80720 RepID=UPI0028CB2C74|nr:LOW QUALITY PROTEIN: SAP30-binding protein [Gadus macrocephalus]